MKERKIGRQIFMGLLGVQGVLELIVGATMLISFSTALESGFGISYSSELDVLGIALGLYLLLLTGLMVLGLFWTLKGKLEGTTIGIITGVFLLLFGIGTFLKLGETQGLFIDSVRGLITIIFGLMARKELKAKS